MVAEHPENKPRSMYRAWLECSVGCPPQVEELCEAFLLGHLEQSEDQLFVRHCEQCRSCRAALSESEDFVHRIREALQDLNEEG